MPWAAPARRTTMPRWSHSWGRRREKRIGATGGRPTNSDMSYFNLEVPTGHGVIVVVGWPGQWSSLWTRDGGYWPTRPGRTGTDPLPLLPGEEVRSPLVVLQFWSGDWLRSQNIWRRWMLAHNVPQAGRQAAPSPNSSAAVRTSTTRCARPTKRTQKMCIDRYLDESISIGHWWMDAGWYPCDTGRLAQDRHLGSRYRSGSPTACARSATTPMPRGSRRSSGSSRSESIPTPGSTENHPEWILGGAAGGLLNLGNPEARQWLTDHVDKLMTEQGIDLYRQDFNMDPLSYWRAADAPDRQGITEIRHVEGYLAYWDALLARHPNMFIDSCASGGRRNDLETMRRAIPLWRTDWRCEPIGTQACTYGISLWLPLSGTGAADVDPYLFRSNMVPMTNCLFDIRNEKLDYDLLRRLVSQWQQVADCYLGDFHPLTMYSLGKDTWMAWQFDLPETGKGMVQAFRREKCVFESGRLKLLGLDPEAQYEIVDLDRNEPQQASGQELMAKGVLVTIADQPGAVVLSYRRVKYAPSSFPLRLVSNRLQPFVEIGRQIGRRFGDVAGGMAEHVQQQAVGHRVSPQVLPDVERIQDELPGPQRVDRHEQTGRVVDRRVGRAGDDFRGRVLADPRRVGDDLSVERVVHQTAGRQSVEDRMVLGPFVLVVQPRRQSHHAALVRQRHPGGGLIALGKHGRREEDDRGTAGDALRQFAEGRRAARRRRIGRCQNDFARSSRSTRRAACVRRAVSTTGPVPRHRPTERLRFRPGGSSAGSAT